MSVEKNIAIKPDSIEVILRNGQSLRIRLVSPNDKKRMEELFYRLSPRSRYLRFQYSKNHITEEDLRHFTEAAPPQRSAYVATTGEGEKERIVAVGSWDMLPDGKGAEIAFTVEDNIQLRGIGTLLLEQLVKAATAHNITRFEARVLDENTRMLEVFDESGFRIEKKLSDGAYEIVIDLKDQEEYSKRQAYREHVARSAGVRKVLCPKRVAVIGASRDPRSVGGALFRNMIEEGFNGVVFPVNPKTDSVAGVLSYPTVLEIPGDIDLAVVVVHASLVMEAIDQCARKGIGSLVIISSGFGESGEEGKSLEKALTEKVLSYGMRVVGPNCLGIMNNDPEVKLNATFSPVAPPFGNLSIGTQSGALGLALLDNALSLNLGIANFVSFGNCIDISNDDLLEYWEDDLNTGVIVLYMESFGNPRKFGRTARRISCKKPIIAVKAGRSKAGAQAATSHTGALAVSDVAVDALFKQSGVIRVDTIQEMFYAAEFLAHQPIPKGPRVGIITNAGGPGVLAADACIGASLKVEPLSESTRKKLREFLPAAASVENPVDMIATASPENYKKTLSILLNDPDIDSLIVIYIPPFVTRPEEVFKAVNEVISGYSGDKPVVTCFMMSEALLSAMRKDSGYSIRPFLFPEEAVRALTHAYNYSLFRFGAEGRVVRFKDIDPEKVRKAAAEWGLEKGWMPPEAALRLLAEYGIPSVETKTAFSPEEAVRLARRIGFPVVMKVRSRTIIHKSDIGGVAFAKDEGEVKKAYSDFLERLGSLGRINEMEGVILQPLVQDARELIVGMSPDPVFGPLVMLGLGGIQVELLKDVAFSIHPLRDTDPGRMLTQLRSFPLLKEWRGRPASDIKALEEALLRFSCLIEDFPEIEQIEINPLLVLNAGKGCLSVDARIYLGKKIS